MFRQSFLCVFVCKNYLNEKLIKLFVKRFWCFGLLIFGFVLDLVFCMFGLYILDFDFCIVDFVFFWILYFGLCILYFSLSFLNVGFGGTFWVSSHLGLNTQIFYKHSSEKVYSMTAHKQLTVGVVYSLKARTRVIKSFWNRRW